MPKESAKKKAERAGRIVAGLAAMYPDSRCSLDHGDPFQLLVATVLSAQCTDARVNAVTPALFARYPTAADLAAAPYEAVEELIRSVNFFRNKSRALLGLSQALVDQFGGRVPRSIEELASLPGVGRKTANVVMGVAFGEAQGVVVDTHVKRIAKRLGLTASEDPVEIERDLLKLLPYDERVTFTHRMIDHGRAICVARTPRCEECGIADLCPSASYVLREPRSPAKNRNER